MNHRSLMIPASRNGGHGPINLAVLNDSWSGQRSTIVASAEERTWQRSNKAAKWRLFMHRRWRSARKCRETEIRQLLNQYRPQAAAVLLLDIHRRIQRPVGSLRRLGTNDSTVLPRSATSEFPSHPPSLPVDTYIWRESSLAHPS